MIVFRLCRSRYSSDLSGKGAESGGGRWNSKGTPMVYTSESRALCLAETAVNLPINYLTDDYRMVSIFIPDNIKIVELKLTDLPADWQSYPHSHSTQIIGDLFVGKKEFLVMKVPSVIVPEELNFLINPLHQMAKSISIEKTLLFRIDNRLKSGTGKQEPISTFRK